MNIVGITDTRLISSAMLGGIVLLLTAARRLAETAAGDSTLPKAMAEM